MSKTLILAASGFGKSSSIGHIPELGIEGLDPKTTYVISATSKPLPFKNSSKIYPVVDRGGKPNSGHRFITNNAKMTADVISFVESEMPEIKKVVWDDSNYVMQDYYMKNALGKGWDAPKQIGYDMGLIFNAMEGAERLDFFVLAHFEEYKDSSIDSVSYRFKTTGKMVQDYITPEGKFDTVLYGKQTFDSKEGKAIKQFVTNFDGQFPAKSPIGMFKDMYIPNDLGLVARTIEEYYG